jgi:hypothetical protein
MHYTSMALLAQIYSRVLHPAVWAFGPTDAVHSIAHTSSIEKQYIYLLINQPNIFIEITVGHEYNQPNTLFCRIIASTQQFALI